MPYLLDANAWIGWLRQNQPKLVARIKQEGAGNIFLCSIVLGELLYGAERSAPTHQAANHQRVQQIAPAVSIHSF